MIERELFFYDKDVYKSEETNYNKHHYKAHKLRKTDLENKLFLLLK